MDDGVRDLFLNLAQSGTPYLSIMHVRDVLVVSLSPGLLEVDGKNWRKYIRPFFPDNFFVDHPVQKLEVQIFSTKSGQYQAVIEQPDGIPGNVKAIRRAGPSKNNILNFVFSGIQAESLEGIEHLHLLTSRTIHYNGQSYSHKKAAGEGWQWEFDTGEYSGVAVISPLVKRATFSFRGNLFSNQTMPAIPVILYINEESEGEINQQSLLKTYQAISHNLRENHYSPRAKVVALARDQPAPARNRHNQMPENGVKLSDALDQIRNEGMRKIIKNTERNPVMQAYLIAFLLGMGLRCRPSFHYLDDQWHVVYSPEKLFDDPLVLEGFGEFGVACLPAGLPIVADVDAPLGAVHTIPVVEGIHRKFLDYGFRLCEKITAGDHVLPWLVTLGDGHFEYEGEAYEFDGPSIFVARQGRSIGQLVSDLASTNFASMVAYILEILYFEQLIQSKPYTGIDLEATPVKIDDYQVIVNWLLAYVPLEKKDEQILRGFEEQLTSLSTLELHKIHKLIEETKNAEVGYNLTEMYKALREKRKTLLEGVKHS
ncbi:hypothetical protein KQH40_00830 [bacterium]|nr:hypothetical protein [bacterium]